MSFRLGRRGAVGASRRVPGAPTPPSNDLLAETWAGTAGAPWPAKWTVPDPSGVVIRNNQGAMEQTGAYTGRFAHAGHASTSDLDLLVSISAASVVEGNIFVTLRSTSTTGTPHSPTGYRVRAYISNGGTRWTIYRGATAVVSDIVGPAITAGTTYRIRAQAVGGDVRARIWAASAAEPSVWHVTYADPTPLPAGTRVWLTASTGGDALSRDFRWDDLVVTAASGGGSTPDPNPTPAPSTAMVGMFRGWNGAANITQWENDNGIDVPLGHEFGDQTQWGWFENGTNFNNWEAWVNAKAGRRFSYSAPLLTMNDSGATQAEKYRRLASGEFDFHFTNLGNAFQSRPALRNSIVRLGWEFNGNSRAWAVPPGDQTTLNNYKIGFNRAAAALLAACPTLEIEWCPNCQLDYTQRLFADMYPGDTHITYIGIGQYDYYWPGGSPTQAQREAWLRDSTNGLADQVALAKSRGKKLAHTEWGLWRTTTTGGGGDRPAYIDFMADWYAQHGYSYHVYNNVAADGEHRLDVYPNAKARYLARFGG